RRAEPGYDLFALVMVFLDITSPKRFAKGPRPQTILEQKINHARPLRLYRAPLKKALRGDYPSCAHMKRDIVRILHDTRIKNKKKTFPPPGLLFVESGILSILGLIYYLFSLLLP